MLRRDRSTTGNALIGSLAARVRPGDTRTMQVPSTMRGIQYYPSTTAISQRSAAPAKSDIRKTPMGRKQSRRHTDNTRPPPPPPPILLLNTACCKSRSTTTGIQHLGSKREARDEGRPSENDGSSPVVWLQRYEFHLPTMTDHTALCRMTCSVPRTRRGALSGCS